MRVHHPVLWLAAVVMLSACSLSMEPESGLACQVPAGRPEVVVAQPERPAYIGRTPAAAATLIQANEPDVEVTWRYSYDTDPDDDRIGYSECWCIPPPDGEVVHAEMTEFGQLLVMVERAQPIVGGRAQPRLGWGCEDAADGAPAGHDGRFIGASYGT